MASPLTEEQTIEPDHPEAFGFGVLFWTIRDAVIVGNARTGLVTMWNPAAERLFGYRAVEIVGTSLERLVPERLRDRHRAGIAHFALEGDGPLTSSEEPIEVPAIRADGQEITVELMLTPLTLLDEHTDRHVVALVRDATGRRRLLAEREAVLATAHEYAARLEELASLKAGFTAMIAHELGGPLAAVRVLADLIAGGALPVEQHSALACAIRAEADVLRRLVEDVAAVAAAERDEFSVQLRPTPLSGLLAEAAAFGRTLPGDHPLSEELAPEAAATMVLVDPTRIGQVLRNLLGNAAKHTPPATPIALMARCVDTRVVIEVRDRGPGIPAEDLSRIFEKFGRGRDALGQRTPGAGLGLYLARRIVASHGGELTVESFPSQGTSFSFDLAVAQ